MTTARHDVLGLGNAIVDVITRADDAFLVEHDMRKGGMALIDEARVAQVYDAMGPAVEISGGSAANTIVGAAGFGARAAFIGKIKDDQLGAAFAHDIKAAGVDFQTPPAADGPSTGRCYVLVTPDGERTMNTYLGAAQDLHARDIDPDMVAGAAITYLEGYLWDPAHAKEAFVKAASIAHEAKRMVALTLSDAFCVDRWRDEFLHLLRSGTVDLVFANEAELQSLYQIADFDSALVALRADARFAVVTRSEKGCVVVEGAHTIASPAFSGGAGDRHHRRRRPVCLRLPVWARARREPRKGGSARGAGGRRSDRSYRRPARDLAQGAGARKRPDGVTEGVSPVFRSAAVGTAPGRSRDHGSHPARHPRASRPHISAARRSRTAASPGSAPTSSRH
jgi:sugar/nucleoside kinase (ribokinase family)